MPTHSPNLVPTDASRLAGSIAAATRALDDAQLVVFPTDTLYGLSALAGSPAAVERLHAARLALAPSASAAEASAWHADSVETVERVMRPAWPVHRRLIRRLLPGAVTLVVEMPAAELARARETLGVAAGVLDDGSAVLLRVPGHPVAEALARAVNAGRAASSGGLRALIAESIPTPAGPARDGRGARERIVECGADVDLILDAGRTPLGRASTRVRLAAGGTWAIEREGAVGRDEVERGATRRVLFVCTGNTCRSPMAESIAADLLAKPPYAVQGAVPTFAGSAGLNAGSGSPMTREAAIALDAINVKPREGGSRDLSGAMLDRADAVYLMTHSHLAAARELAQREGVDTGKLHLLDPGGRDIPDPIGGPQAQYSSLAQSLRSMIARRLEELDE